MKERRTIYYLIFTVIMLCLVSKSIYSDEESHEVREEVNELRTIFQDIQTVLEKTNSLHAQLFIINKNKFLTNYENYLSDCKIIGLELQKIIEKTPDSEPNREVFNILLANLQEYMDNALIKLIESYEDQIRPYVYKVITDDPSFLDEVNKPKFEYKPKIRKIVTANNFLINELQKKLENIQVENELFLEKLKRKRSLYTNSVKNLVSKKEISKKEISLKNLWFLEEVLAYSLLEAQINKYLIQAEFLKELKNKLTILSNNKNLQDEDIKWLRDTSLEINLSHAQIKLKPKQKILNYTLNGGLVAGSFVVSTFRIFLVLDTIDIFHTVSSGFFLRGSQGLSYASETTDKALRKAWLNNFAPSTAYPTWLGFASFVPASQLVHISTNAITSSVMKNIAFNYRLKNLGSYSVSGISMAVAMKVMDIVQTAFLLNWELNSDDPEINNKAKAYLSTKAAITKGNSAMFFNSALSFTVSDFFLDLFWKRGTGLDFLSFKKLMQKVKNEKDCNISIQKLAELIKNGEQKAKFSSFLKDFFKDGSRELILFFNAGLIDSWLISSWLFEDTTKQDMNKISCFQNNLLTAIKAGLIRDLISIDKNRGTPFFEIEAILKKYSASKMLKNNLIMDSYYKIYEIKKDKFLSCLNKTPSINENRPPLIIDQFLDEQKYAISGDCKMLIINLEDTDPYKEAVTCFNDLLSSDVEDPNFFIEDGLNFDKPELIKKGIDRINLTILEAKLELEQANSDDLLKILSPDKELDSATKMIQKLNRKYIGTRAIISEREYIRKAILGFLKSKDYQNFLDDGSYSYVNLFKQIDASTFYSYFKNLIEAAAKLNNEKESFDELYVILKNNLLNIFSNRQYEVKYPSDSLKTSLYSKDFASVVDSLIASKFAASNLSINDNFKVKCILHLFEGVSKKLELEDKEKIRPIVKEQFLKAINEKELNPELKQILIDSYNILFARLQ